MTELHEELQCWLDCYGKEITLGAKVTVSKDFKYHADYDDDTFMVTSLSFDADGLNIGINGGGDNWDTEYDGFRINELAIAS